MLGGVFKSNGRRVFGYYDNVTVYVNPNFSITIDAENGHYQDCAHFPKEDFLLLFQHLEKAKKVVEAGDLDLVIESVTPRKSQEA